MSGTYLAIKRHTQAARDRGRPQRHQRRCTEEQARRLVERWEADPDVKAVWIYGPGNTEVYHQVLDRAGG